MWWLAVMLMLSEALCFDWAPLPLGELTPDSLVVFHLHSPKTGGVLLVRIFEELEYGKEGSSLLSRKQLGLWSPC